MKKIIILSIIAVLLYFGYCFFVSNPFKSKTIKDIPAPIGCSRVSDSSSKAEFLRNLPLRSVGTRAYTYKNHNGISGFITYAVIDIPVISNSEQCADMCMRLHAEHQFRHNLPIRFKSVNNEPLVFHGKSHKDLYNYLNKVYAVASTYSLSKLPNKDFKDVKIGDIFVYPSREKGRYGHAITVVDVAKDPFGNIYLMLAEGSTPACDLHILRNYRNPFNSAWFKLNPNPSKGYIRFDGNKYYKDELRYFSNHIFGHCDCCHA